MILGLKKENKLHAIMISYIAISAEINSFKNERVLDPAWAKKFPGALWMAVLAEKLRKRSIIVTTVDVALTHVKQNYWDAHQIGVVQHVDDSESEELIALGGTPLILTVFESPLYINSFYESLNFIAPKFKNRVLFAGALHLFNANGGENFSVRFPSYNPSEIIESVPWNSREFMVMVVNNKYILNSTYLNVRYPFDCLKWIKWKLKSYFDPSIIIFSRKMSNSQFQDKRLSAIHFFGNAGLLKLFGMGWESLKNLPHSWKGMLNPVIQKLNPDYINWHEKKDIISKYKYALCFENFSYSGYVTEKIIDCFVAGVIPIYIGAPDIENFVPKDSFIDVRHYKSWEDLLDILNNITEEQASAMIDSGRKFLSTDEGYLHSYNGFASFMESLILKELNKSLIES